MEVLVISVGTYESLPILLTNSKREPTIKKSTTHVVSGAFDVVDYATSDRSVTGKSPAEMETNIVISLWITLSLILIVIH